MYAIHPNIEKLDILTLLINCLPELQNVWIFHWFAYDYERLGARIVFLAYNQT